MNNKWEAGARLEPQLRRCMTIRLMILMYAPPSCGQVGGVAGHPWPGLPGPCQRQGHLAYGEKISVLPVGRGPRPNPVPRGRAGGDTGKSHRHLTGGFPILARASWAGQLGQLT